MESTKAIERQSFFVFIFHLRVFYYRLYSFVFFYFRRTRLDQPLKGFLISRRHFLKDSPVMVRSGQTGHVIEIKVALDVESIGEEIKSSWLAIVSSWITSNLWAALSLNSLP